MEKIIYSTFDSKIYFVSKEPNPWMPSMVKSLINRTDYSFYKDSKESVGKFYQTFLLMYFPAWNFSFEFSSYNMLDYAVGPQENYVTILNHNPAAYTRQIISYKFDSTFLKSGLAIPQFNNYKFSRSKLRDQYLDMLLEDKSP